ncbi:MAG TPA: ATP-binding protein [Crinalium sp.]|jgi:signal transduction histidine kinase/DNA-binding response OmpR family regulator
MAADRQHRQQLPGLPLSLVLVVPFVLQIFATVGLVGYLSFRNGQKAVSSLALHLSNEISDRVDQHLDNYLALPHQLGQLAIDAMEHGELDIHNFKQVGRYFWKRAQIYPNINLLCYYLQNGQGVGAGRWLEGRGITIVEHSLTDGKDYTYATDAQGNRTDILDATTYYAPTDQWYVDAVKAGKPAWSRIYTADGFVGYVAASAVYPIYDQNHKLLGALSVDLLLSEISRFLHGLDISPHGKVFIVERNGMLIGNSSDSPAYNIVNNQTQRLSALESPDPVIRSTAHYLKQQFTNFQSIQKQTHLEYLLDGKRQFVQVLPWQDEYGLDWLVVVTIPESDFMTEINANTRTTVLLCLAALAIAILLGMYTARWITRPILRLSQASQAIAAGDLNQSVQIQGIWELNTLSNAFNRMAQQLKDSFDLLETRVIERTAELADAKQSAERAKEAADAANRAKSEFLASMSHELRTPLNAVLGFTQLLNRDLSLKKEQRENLEIISRSGDHLLALINDVLDMSKIEAGRVTLQESDVDLHRLLSNIEDMLRLKASLKGLNFLCHYSLNLPKYVRIDERKLRQVLLNLLGNAIKFTKHGYVVLRVYSQMDRGLPDEPIQLFFSVEDTGPGIETHELDGIFQPFVQTELGLSTQEGTGLGLPISRKFVQLMGGDITVKSQAGHGSTFSFNVQAHLSDVSKIEAAKPCQRVIGLEPGQSTKRILVVDDRWENRQLVVKLLTPLGFDVREAANGQEAIATWETWEPHLILMDMRMPVINGYEATQYIKSHLRGQATIIIALTASTFEEDCNTIKFASLDDFIRKPFQEDVLLHKISQHLGVKYLYQQGDESLQHQTTQTISETSLMIMPFEWRQELHKASAELDSQVAYRLIEQIPSEYAALADILRQKVEQFDFDQLMDLTQ